MISIRKSWWAALAASAIAGCSNNTQQSTTAAPPPVTSGPAPEAPLSESGGTSAEMNPPASSAPTPGHLPKTTAPETTSKPEPADIEGTEVEGPAPTPAKPEGSKDLKPEEEADAAEVGKAGDEALSDEEVAEIKKLPAADAAKALAQKVCPVSGENLGGMGVPVRVSAEGKTFFLCCKGCNKEVKSNPKAVVAKLKQ
jgi:YHS domain-containing protein